MRSRTKLELDQETISRLFEKAGIGGTENILPLGAGEYNSVYSADVGENAYAIKVAPRESAKNLTYEQHLMPQGGYYYSIMTSEARIDPERSLWGDRIADFACLDFGNMSLDKKTATLQAYNKATEQPITTGS